MTDTDTEQAAAVWFPAAELVPWRRNYLVHPQAQLDRIKASIRRNGWGEPCMAQSSSARLIAGHGRIAAYLQLLGDADPLQELAALDTEERRRLLDGLVPVRFRDVPDDRADELAIADNESARMAVRDDDRLAGVVRDLADDDGGVAHLALGMDTHGLAALLAPPKPDPRDVRTPPAPPVPTAPDSVRGGRYELGPHVLVCADSHDAATAELLLQGDRCAMAFTDPPFAIYGSSSGISSSVADDSMVIPFFLAAWHALERCLAVFAHAYVCCDWRSYPTLWTAMKGSHFQPSNLLMWDKGHAGLGSKWQNTHELILFAELLPEQGTMRGKATGHRLVQGRSNILRASRPTGADRPHNASKPTDLIGQVLEAGSETGDLVLDLYGGGGATLIACAQHDRRCRIVEKEPGWCDVIRRRWHTWATEAGVDPGPGALAVEGD